MELFLPDNIWSESGLCDIMKFEVDVEKAVQRRYQSWPSNLNKNDKDFS